MIGAGCFELADAMRAVWDSCTLLARLSACRSTSREQQATINSYTIWHFSAHSLRHGRAGRWSVLCSHPPAPSRGCSLSQCAVADVAVCLFCQARVRSRLC